MRILRARAVNGRVLLNDVAASCREAKVVCLVVMKSGPGGLGHPLQEQKRWSRESRVLGQLGKGH